jgi:ubiquinone/menaquinone biosynthesis C-methylase UbiE
MRGIASVILNSFPDEQTLQTGLVVLSCSNRYATRIRSLVKQRYAHIRWTILSRYHYGDYIGGDELIVSTDAVNLGQKLRLLRDIRARRFDVVVLAWVSEPSFTLLKIFGLFSNFGFLRIFDEHLASFYLHRKDFPQWRRHIVGRLRKRGVFYVANIFSWIILSPIGLLYILLQTVRYGLVKTLYSVADGVQSDAGTTRHTAEHWLQQMKVDWNQRASEDARYYIHSTKRHQIEEEFDASGKDSVEKLILADLQTIAENKNPKAMSVLEIGCGIGRMTKYLAGTFGQVHSVDVSEVMIREARKRLRAFTNVFLYEVNGNNLSLFPNDMFDFAFSFLVFQHIPIKEIILNYIREVHRVLKPGGIFKFQVQGCTTGLFQRIQNNTWLGVTIKEEDIESVSRDIGFECISKAGQGTQYSWYTLKKKHLSSIRKISRP